MGRGWKIGATLIVVWLFLLLAGFWAKPNGRGAFAKYICVPVPASVGNIAFDGNDWFGIAPEPVCYFWFSIGSNDVSKVVAAKAYKSVKSDDMFSPGGPVWFRPPLSGTNGQFYRNRGRR